MFVLSQDPLLPLVLVSIRGGLMPAARHVTLIDLVHLGDRSMSRG